MRNVVGHEGTRVHSPYGHVRLYYEQTVAVKKEEMHAMQVCRCMFFRQMTQMLQALNYGTVAAATREFIY